MKNICFVNSVKFWGGGEKLHLEYALQLEELGYRVFIACEKDSALQVAAEKAGIDTFPCSVSGLSFLNPFKLLAMKRFFVAENIDCTFFSISKDAKFVAFAAWLADLERIVYLRGLAKPIKSTFLNRLLVGKLLTHLVVNSLATQKTALQYFKEADVTARLSVVYHGIDLELFDRKLAEYAADSARKPGTEAIVIGTAGRLETQKGHGYLIQAAQELSDSGRDFEILIAGTGSHAEQLQAKIDELGLQDKVQLCGFCDNIEEFLQQIDLFVLPSLWEGFGYAIVEAMAASKPVVAYRLSSNPEIIADQLSGVLVPFEQEGALSAAIAGLMDDPEKSRLMGQAGRARVEERFQLSGAVDELIRQLA